MNTFGMTMPPAAAILPQDTNEAVKALIAITDRLTEIMEDDNRAITLRDPVLLAANDREKDQLAEKYRLAAAEFRMRLEEFRSADKALLDELHEAQTALGDLTKGNLDFIAPASRG